MDDITDLAQEYRQVLAACYSKRLATSLFVESYIEELRRFTHEEQQEFVMAAQADPRWWVSLGGQWQSPVRLEL